MLLKKTIVVLAALVLAPSLLISDVSAQQTGVGGGTGGGTGVDAGGGFTGGSGGGAGGGTGADNSGLSAPSELVSQPDFEDIRREVDFAGQSLANIVHPFSESFTLSSDFEEIAGGNSAASNAGGARTTTGAAGNTVQSPFGGFNDPFQALFFSQFQTQNAIIRSRLSFEKSEFLPPPEGTLASTEAAEIDARQTRLIGSRVRSLPNMNQADVQVSIVDGTATLNGSVESEARKKQLERLLKMEAGVRAVVNNLQVL